MAVSSLLQTQFNLYQGTSDNSLLRVKLAQAERLKKEYAAIEDKYDGSVQASYEAKLEAAVEAKAGMSKSLQNVQSALGKMDDIRNKLLEMRSAANTGSAEAFDYAYSTLSTMVGSSWLDSENLMANNRTSSMTWPEKTSIAFGGGYQVQVTNYFLGSDYAIELDDGSGAVRPNLSTNKLEGGSLEGHSFADISNPVINGDQISFDVGGVTYSGTLHRGGGGVMNAWAYENFTGSDPAAAKSAAMSDIDDALDRIRKAEIQWNIAGAQLESAFNRLGVAQDDAQKEFEEISYEQLDAKNAEKKAAKARFDLATNGLALTASRSTDFIYQMFISNPIADKKSILEIVGGY